MSDYYLVVAFLPARADRIDELQSRLTTMMEAAVRDEPGLVRYSVHRVKDSSTLMHVEVYASEAAFQDHLGSAHVGALLEGVDKLLDGEIVTHEGLPVRLVDDPRTSLV